MPKARGFGVLPALPNAGSPHQTPASVMIDSHYLSLQLIPRWTWERYARFCQFMRMTPYEVASLVMLRHDSVANYKENNVLTGPNARAIALLLTLLEAHMLKGWTDDLIENPFPDLTSHQP